MNPPSTNPPVIQLENIKMTAILGQITALCFISPSLLLASCGRSVSLYDTLTSTKVSTANMFKQSRVHCIRVIGNGEVGQFNGGDTAEVDKSNEQGDKKVNEKFKGTKLGGFQVKVLMYGGKSIAICSVLNNIITVNHVIVTKYWIFDAIALYDSTIAVLNSRNHVERWHIESGLLEERKCSDRTHIYSGAIFGTDWNSLEIASGTLFQQIVIWTVRKTELNRFVGHNVHHLK